MTIDRSYVERQHAIRRDVLVRLYARQAENPWPNDSNDAWISRETLVRDCAGEPGEIAFAIRFLFAAGKVISCHPAGVTPAEPKYRISHLGEAAVEKELLEEQGE